jgi:hypothetical protein
VALIAFLPAGGAMAQTWYSVNATGDGGDDERLERLLAERGSVDFHETPLRDVVESLRQQFQKPFLLSGKKLEEAGISIDSPVTIRLEQLPLESILQLMLDSLELDFTVRDGVVLITTPEDVEGQLRTRVYPVLDLVLVEVPSGKARAKSLGADYDSLIDLITATIKPDSWDDVGGPGAIDSLPNAGALVVSQTRDVQRQVESLLIMLRRAKTRQGIASVSLPATAGGAIVPAASSRSARRYSAAATSSWQLPQVYSAEPNFLSP